MERARRDRRDREVVRILGILKLLIEGGHPTVYQLAARFRVRRETIYRDFRALQDIGYPIQGDDAGRLSRPRLALAVRPATPPVLLTRQEVAALTWSARHAAARQPFRGALDTAVPKLQALVPGADAQAAMALEHAVGGWERGVKDVSELGPTVLRLVQAIVGRHRCRIAYQAPGRDRPRTFAYDPYRLLSVHGGLYAIGQGPTSERLTTLALDRIRELALTEDGFTVSASFDPKRYEAEAFGVVWERPMAVVVRFRADQAPYVREREWHPTQRFRTRRDGRLEMTFHAGGTFEITRWLLGWGDAAEVVRPARLRHEVRAILRSAADWYGGT